ncbi:MAG TPA: hypothetical protein VI248_19035 [Kineosporiaceae bacterium]
MPGQDSGEATTRRRLPTLLIGRGPMLTGTAVALAMVVVAVGVARGPAHAADPTVPTAPEDAVAWDPGQVTYQVDASGCHTIQTAQLRTATPAIADTVSAALTSDSIKVKTFNQDPDIKAVEVNNVQKNNTTNTISLTIDGWLSNQVCAQSTSGSAQQASLTTGSAAHQPTGTRVLGTVDLGHRDRIALVAGTSWFKQAVKVVAAAAAFVGITAIALGVIVSTAASGAPFLTLAATAMLAGCIAGAATDLIITRLFFPEDAPTAKDRIGVAVEGCLRGATLGATTLTRVGRGIPAGVRRRLNTEDAIVGQSTMDAAGQARVTLTGLATMVDGVAEGALRAAQ